jgi:hypothetical protein
LLVYVVYFQWIRHFLALFFRVGLSVCPFRGGLTDSASPFAASSNPYWSVLDFLQGVGPPEELGVFLGLFEAFIELVADFAGRMGDFAVAGVHSVGGLN